MPRRHVVGLSLIAAIAVVLITSIVVRSLPLGPDTPGATPGIAQVGAPVTVPSRVIASQPPAPGTPPAPAAAPSVAGAPVRLPAPPPPMREANPRRQIASIRERPQPARSETHRHCPRHGHSRT